jgi:membrane-bound lytic murein transglycosylase B
VTPRTAFTFVPIALLFAGITHADGSFSGRTRLDLDRPEIREFVEATAAEQKIEPLEVYRLLAKAEPQPKIIEMVTKPAEKVSPWWQYRERFLTEQRIAEGTQFMQEHRAQLQKAHRDTGVAPEYIVAIIGVETFYGRITGKYRVLDALTTLSFDYPARAEYFKGELAQFIALSREEAVDPLTAMGSYAGAMGASQFMPSSYRQYAVDGNNDKKRDLFADWDDIIASVANYFKAHGWVADGPVLSDAVLQPDAPVVADPANLALNETVAGLRAKGVDFDPVAQAASTPVLLVPAEQQLGPSYRVGFKNFEVITRYNRSVRYAMAVHDLAQTIAGRVAVADAATAGHDRNTQLAARPSIEEAVAR